jgi:ectoine hydroxylase-related dioxygenase (phytanoyl-CoA dioxygenase family)
MDVSFFHQHGYQVLPGLLDANAVAGVGDFLKRAMDDSFALLAAHGIELDRDGPAAQIDQLLTTRRAELSADAHSVLVGHFPLKVRLARELWAIPAQARLQAAIRAALGEDRLFMHMPPTARFVLPGNAHAGVPAHQDVSYNTHVDNFVVAWVPFVPIDPQCGGVTVFEGSQKAEIVPVELKGSWLEGVDTAGYKPHHCQPMGPGDVLLISKSIIHGSTANMSDRTRFSVDFRFFGGSVTSRKHCLDLETMTVLDPAA